MSKPKIVDDRSGDVVTFGDLDIGETFMYNSTLCTKIAVSAAEDNAFDHIECMSLGLSGNDKVRRVNVEIRILK